MYLCYHRVISCLQLSKYVVVLVCKFNQIRKFIFLFFLPSLLALVVFPPPSLHPSFLLKASQTGQKHPWHQERARRHSWRHSSHLHTAHRRRSMTQRKPWSFSFLYTLRSKSQYVCCSHNQHTISTWSHVRVTWSAHNLMWGSHDWHTISCEGHMISVASDHVSWKQSDDYWVFLSCSCGECRRLLASHIQVRLDKEMKLGHSLLHAQHCWFIQWLHSIVLFYELVQIKMTNSPRPRKNSVVGQLSLSPGRWDLNIACGSFDLCTISCESYARA